MDLKVADMIVVLAVVAVKGNSYQNSFIDAPNPCSTGGSLATTAVR